MTNPEIVQHYQDADEDARLQSGACRFEFVRTLEIMERKLPPPPARVLDVGGATGAYSQALGERGYETHLLDPVPKHVQTAYTRSAIAGAAVGDARQLRWPDESFDAVLLMGPLYHLVDAEERGKALAEALRVLKGGGALLAAAIGRFASLLDGLSRAFVDDPRFVSILLADLETGQHRNPTGDLNYFTTSYFHMPAELEAEVRGAGFEGVEVYGVEGPIWAAPDLDARWDDPVKREFTLDLLRRIEREASLLGASQHLLAAARKPGRKPGRK